MEYRPEDHGEDVGRRCEFTTMHCALNLVHLQSPPPARCKCLGCTVFTSCFSREQILMEREGGGSDVLSVGQGHGTNSNA